MLIFFLCWALLAGSFAPINSTSLPLLHSLPCLLGSLVEMSDTRALRFKSIKKRCIGGERSFVHSPRLYPSTPFHCNPFHSAALHSAPLYATLLQARSQVRCTNETSCGWCQSFAFLKLYMKHVNESKIGQENAKLWGLKVLMHFLCSFQLA